MKIATFWCIIDRTQAEDQDAQERLLWEELIPMKKEEIIDFQRMFKELINKLPDSIICNNQEDFNKPRWDISPLRKKLIKFGKFNSDYDFYDFKEWIICQGQQTYVEALIEPDAFVIKSKYPYSDNVYASIEKILKKK